MRSYSRREFRCRKSTEWMPWRRCRRRGRSAPSCLEFLGIHRLNSASLVGSERADPPVTVREANAAVRLSLVCFCSLRTSSSSPPLGAGDRTVVLIGGDERAEDLLGDAFGGRSIGLAKLDGASAEKGGGDSRWGFDVRLVVTGSGDLGTLDEVRGRGDMFESGDDFVVGVVDLGRIDDDLGVAGFRVGGELLTSTTGLEISTFRTGILEGVCFPPGASAIAFARSLRSLRIREGVVTGRTMPEAT